MNLVFIKAKTPFSEGIVPHVINLEALVNIEERTEMIKEKGGNIKRLVTTRLYFIDDPDGYLCLEDLSIQEFNDRIVPFPFKNKEGDSDCANAQE